MSIEKQLNGAFVLVDNLLTGEGKTAIPVEVQTEIIDGKEVQTIRTVNGGTDISEIAQQSASEPQSGVVRPGKDSPPFPSNA